MTCLAPRWKSSSACGVLYAVRLGVRRENAGLWLGAGVRLRRFAAGCALAGTGRPSSFAEAVARALEGSRDRQVLFTIGAARGPNPEPDTSKRLCKIGDSGGPPGRGPRSGMPWRYHTGFARGGTARRQERGGPLGGPQVRPRPLSDHDRLPAGPSPARPAGGPPPPRPLPWWRCPGAQALRA